MSGRVAGTVRRHIPLDTRDPPGAILHFYVGDSYDYCGYFIDLFPNPFCVVNYCYFCYCSCSFISIFSIVSCYLYL